VGIKSRTATPPQPIPGAPFFGYYVSDPETYFHAVWDLNDDLFDTYNGAKTVKNVIYLPWNNILLHFQYEIYDTIINGQGSS